MRPKTACYFYTDILAGSNGNFGGKNVQCSNLISFSFDFSSELMGRQARFVNWFCSSYSYINTQKKRL